MESEEIPADEEHALQELTYQEAAEMMGKLSPELKRLVRADRKNAARSPFQKSSGGFCMILCCESWIRMER